MGALDFNLRREQARQLIGEVGKNGSETIEYFELMKIVHNKLAYREPNEQIMKAFSLIDDTLIG